MSTKRHLSIFLLQAFVVAVITFLVAELTLRLYNRISPSFVFYSTSYNRFRGKPFAPDYDFHLNSKGFKDVEFNTQKAINNATS